MYPESKSGFRRGTTMDREEDGAHPRTKRQKASSSHRVSKLKDYAIK